MGIGLETTWGTPVAATDHVESMSESIASALDRFETRNIVGRFTEPDDAAGVERHQGGWVFHGHPVSIGYALNGVFGINSVTSLATNFMRNDFTPKQSDQSSLHPLPPYTIEAYRAGTLVNTSFRYAGAQFSGLTMALAPNQDLRCTAAVIAKARTFLAKSTPSFPGSPVHPFTFDTASLSLGGSAVDRIEALTIAIDNQLEGVPTLNNDNEIAKVRRTGPPMIAISGTVDFVDMTDFESYIDQTEQRLVLSLFKANSFQLVIDVPRMIYTAFPVSMPGRERLTVDFTGKARYHTGSGNAIKVQLTTTQSY